MKTTITTQAELDKLLRIEAGDEVILQTRLNLNADLEVFGALSIKIGLECAWDKRVEARGNASVVARGNASVEARENASVVAWGNALVRASSSTLKLNLKGYSLLSMPADLRLNFSAEATVAVQKYQPQKFLDREGVPVSNEKVVLYKRVSVDFKTQEGTENETLWKVGETIIHPAWEPKSGECGAGKYHACSRPYFTDEFRSTKGDRYIAIEVDFEDLYEWPNPDYPHKIAFRSGLILGEVDRFGKKMTHWA